MVGIIIPSWLIWTVLIYLILNLALSIWKNILNEQLKKETKKLVNNQQLIKDLRDTIEKQNNSGLGRKESE